MGRELATGMDVLSRAVELILALAGEDPSQPAYRSNSQSTLAAQSIDDLNSTGKSIQQQLKSELTKEATNDLLKSGDLPDSLIDGGALADLCVLSKMGGVIFQCFDSQSAGNITVADAMRLVPLLLTLKRIQQTTSPRFQVTAVATDKSGQVQQLMARMLHINPKPRLKGWHPSLHIQLTAQATLKSINEAFDLPCETVGPCAMTGRARNGDAFLLPEGIASQELFTTHEHVKKADDGEIVIEARKTASRLTP